MQVYESVWTSAPLLQGKSFGKNKGGELQATHGEGKNMGGINIQKRLKNLTSV